MFICAINIFYQNYTWKNKNNYKVGNIELKCQISDIQIDGNKIDLIIKNKEKIKGTYYVESLEELNYLKNKLCLGDYILVEGKLTKPSTRKIPNTFNYQNYLKHQDIYYVIQINSLKFINHSNNPFIILKNIIIKRINSYANNKEYLMAFIVGNKAYLADDVLDSYRKMGISHLFAVSGMHVSLLILALNKILKHFKLVKWFKELILICLLSYFAFLTNFTASILRTLCFLLCLKLNEKLDFKLSSKKILLYSVIILLFLNYNLFFDLGFRYSVIATFGLIYSSKLLRNLNYLSKILVVSIVCLLFTLPITINNFYEFNLLSIIPNIIFVPLISLIIFPLSALVLFFPYLNEILTLFIKSMTFITSYMKYINISISIPRMNIIFVLLYYFFLLLLIHTKRKKYFITLILIILVVKGKIFLNPNYYIYFLDVGQGDSILIKSPYNKEIIMIDTGGRLEYNLKDWQQRKSKSNLSDSTITFLKSIGIDRIDLLIITHGDADHIGEAIHLSERIKIKNVLLNKGEQNKLEQEISNKLNVVNQYSFKTINAVFLNDNIYDNENDNSIVTLFKINKYKLLFMGDASTKVENDILNKYTFTSDFIKLGHHGSNTSSSKEFLNTIQAQIAFNSSGVDNKYNHPSKETLDTLKDLQIKLYDTQEFGTIILKIKKKTYTISTY